MRRIGIVASAAFIVALSSCGKDFMKDQSGSFKVNGTAYTTETDNVSAGYVNGGSQYLQISLFTGNSQTNTPVVTVDLNRVDETVLFTSANSGFTYTTLTGGTYTADYGQYKITSHEEGNPSSRHTEGTFEMTLHDVNNDTIKITEGKFYVNNY
jgi:hypothetical protein